MKRVALAAALLILAGCDVGEPPRLSLDVTFDGDQFRISNLDDFDWRECEFEINPKRLHDGYSFHAQGVKAHDYETAEVSRFADESGLIFDPRTHAAREFVAVCSTPHGKLVQDVTPTVVRSN
jgi:hypothetical protein